jgi:NADH-quinone oxidoreductase subunit L
MGLLAGLLTLFFFWSGAGGFDTYIVDGVVNGAAYTSGFFGILFKKFQTGRVQSYLVLAILGVMVFFFWFK